MEDKEPLLTPMNKREREILERLATGLSDQQIADELFLSVKTVSTYRARILQKMDMKTNADLTYYAIKNQLIQ